jgi:hypothetical protein
MVRARISLPEPVSPVISTDAEDGADLLDYSHDILHHLRLANQIAQSSCFAQLACQRRHLAPVANVAQRTVQQGSRNTSPLQRLFDIPECACFDRGDDALFTALARDDDSGNSSQFLAQPGQHVQTIHSWKFHVGY